MYLLRRRLLPAGSSGRCQPSWESAKGNQYLTRGRIEWAWERDVRGESERVDLIERERKWATSKTSEKSREKDFFLEKTLKTLSKVSRTNQWNCVWFHWLWIGYYIALLQKRSAGYARYFESRFNLRAQPPIANSLQPCRPLSGYWRRYALRRKLKVSSSLSFIHHPHHPTLTRSSAKLSRRRDAHTTTPRAHQHSVNFVFVCVQVECYFRVERVSH